MLQTLDRGNKMPIVTRVTCSKCQKEIADGKGFGLVGDIHLISTQIATGLGKGLIGTNFDKEGKIVNVMHFHEACMLELLHIKVPTESKEKE
jgi:hypothetical protein